MGKMIFNQEESFLLSDSEYSIDTALAIRRRTVHRTDDENMITRRDYLIDGKRITVNSVFNMLKNQSAVKLKKFIWIYEPIGSILCLQKQLRSLNRFDF